MKLNFDDNDELAEIMDDILTEKHVQTVIDMPEGTQVPSITCNVGTGALLHLYILLKALPAVYRELRPMLEPGFRQRFIDEVLGMVRDDMLSEETDEEAEK